MARTSAALVAEVLAYNYDNLRAPSLNPFIDSASAVVDQLVSDAAVKGMTLPAATLELIERWLAGYFYCKMDPLFASKSTQGANATYVTSQSLGAEQERYKRAAIELDFSGCLNSLLNRQRAGATLLRVDDPYDTLGNNPDQD